VGPQVAATGTPLSECETKLAPASNWAPWLDEDFALLWADDDAMLLEERVDIVALVVMVCLTGTAAPG